MLASREPPMPSMNGALRPNQKLDHALLLAECPAPDNLLWQDDHLLFTSGKRVLLLDNLHQEEAEPEEILHSMARSPRSPRAEDGSLAVALGAAGIVLVGGTYDGNDHRQPRRQAVDRADRLGLRRCGTRCSSCVGSDVHPVADWQHDLREQRMTGSVWRLSLNGGTAVCLAADLAFPSGLVLHDGRIAVSGGLAESSARFSHAGSGGAARPARRPAGLSRPAIAGARRRRMARRLCAAHALGTVACLWARGAAGIAISSRRNRSTVTPTEGARVSAQLPGDPRRAHRGVQGRQCLGLLPI